MKTGLLLGVTGILMTTQLRVALACGCLAIPSAATPVLQAGERILFAKDGSEVVAYIQIKYEGSADRFGWLLPLPSVPTLQLGTDELFDKLGRETQPVYRLNTQNQYCNGSSSSSSRNVSSGGCGSSEEDYVTASDGGAGAVGAADLGQRMNEVVVRGGIGPYDYAVLHADNQNEMLDWLRNNQFFVPDGTGQALTPYIHPGAYFLALKLHSGESSGDIVPVIVRYQSDLPMIPIILTQVGAVPNMGILVWLLGEGRAIPRNYYHTVLNEMGVWLNTDQTYESLVVRAIKEAPKRHSFLTEFAGSSAVMQGKLDWPGRFGSLTVLKQITTPSSYLQYLQDHDYLFDTTLVEILSRYLPEPQLLVDQKISLQDYYRYYDNYQTQPAPDAGAPPLFDPAGLTDAIEMRIVQPTRDTAALFGAHPYLTRLFTALSPEDMNADPVFSESSELGDVPLVHEATLTVPCNGTPWLKANDFEVQYPRFSPPKPVMPASLRIETLRELGDPTVVTDNSRNIIAALGPVDHSSSSSSSTINRDNNNTGACNIPRRGAGDLGALLLVGGAIVFSRRSRRKEL